MNKKWSDEDLKIYSLKELSPGRQGLHAAYRIVSLDTIFNIILFQEVFPGKSSRFHFHPAIEIFVVLKGELIIETHKGEKKVPPRSVICVPKNVIHRVKNAGDSNTLSLLLIEQGYKEEDVVHVEKREDAWYKVRQRS